MNCLCIVLAVCLSSSAFAQNAKPIADFFRPFVNEIDKPVLVYNWGNLNSSDPNFAGMFSSNGDIAQARARARANLYWDKTTDQSTDMYGPGLYVALDPTSSRSYAGPGDGWLLSEFGLPKGFRFINLLHDGDLEVPDALKSNLLDAKCPDTMITLNELLRSKYQVNETCVHFVKKIFADELHIDGFLYVYKSALFKECPAPWVPEGSDTVPYNPSPNYFPERNAAFVLTSSRWMNSETVHIYNAKSRENTDSRRRIMSLFYKAASDTVTVLDREHRLDIWQISQYESYVRDLIPNLYPGWIYQSSIGAQPGCNGDETCRSHAQICLASSATGSPVCKSIAWPAYPIPRLATVISRTQLPTDFDSSITSLWSDLEGAPITPDLSTWVRSNFFGCSPRTNTK